MTAMKNSVTVAVATYGSMAWKRLATTRAIPSVRALGVPVVSHHGIELHDARNAALAQVQTEWVVHLDADDELEPGFFEAMAAGTADVRAPAVRYIQPNGQASHPRMPRVAGHDHDCISDCLLTGNWLVVGACVRTELARQAKWRDYPLYEDWDYWLQCYLLGATFQAVPNAIYRAHVRRNSRNRAPSRETKFRTHRAIEAANGLLPGGERA